MKALRIFVVSSRRAPKRRKRRPQQVQFPEQVGHVVGGPRNDKIGWFWWLKALRF